MSKAVQISEESYDNINKARKLAIKKAEGERNTDLANAFKGMGRGAFAGYLINEGLSNLEKKREGKKK